MNSKNEGQPSTVLRIYDDIVVSSCVAIIRVLFIFSFSTNSDMNRHRKWGISSVLRSRMTLFYHVAIIYFFLVWLFSLSQPIVMVVLVQDHVRVLFYEIWIYQVQCLGTQLQPSSQQRVPHFLKRQASSDYLEIWFQHCFQCEKRVLSLV
jgi:hypothetical protein